MLCIGCLQPTGMIMSSKGKNWILRAKRIIPAKVFLQTMKECIEFTEQQLPERRLLN
jgi:hypothetical protein